MKNQRKSSKMILLLAGLLLFQTVGSPAGMTGYAAENNAETEDDKAAAETPETAEEDGIGEDGGNISAEDETDAEKEDEEKLHSEAEAKARSIVFSLTLEEKIGQMIMPCARTWSDTPEASDSYQNMTVLNEPLAAAIADYNLCGLCLFTQNSESTEQLVQLTSDLQAAAASSSSGISLFLSIDQEGGYVTRLSDGTSMIGNMALAATGDPENAKIEAEIISSELQAVGINVDFAPDSDINDNPQNPVIGVRSFSDDADTVSEYAAEYIEGLHENNVISCLKHFPGHGNTSTDSHTGLPLIDKSLEELEEEELKPFAALCDETDMIMTAHIQFPQIETETYVSVSTGEEICLPATMSETIIRGILREEMGFDGVVVTDAFEMSAISDNFDLAYAVKASINADVDLILMPFDLQNAERIEELGLLISEIEEMVYAGEIEESEIDDSVVRILTLKIERGIWNPEDSEETVTSEAVEMGMDAAEKEEISEAGEKETEDQAETLKEEKAEVPEIADEAEVPENADEETEKAAETEGEKSKGGSEASESDDSVAKALSIIGSAEHHEVEKTLAEKAITLYQDSNGTYANGIGAEERVLYLYPVSSQDLSLDLALQWVTEDGISTENMTFDKVCYDGLTVSEVQEKLDSADRVILVTKTSSLSSLDAENPSDKAAFCQAVISEAHSQGKEVDLISSQLPYDAAYYRQADVILLAYNPAGVTELPESYDGHTLKYGPNLPAAIAALITGRELTGVCPVEIPDLFS